MILNSSVSEIKKIYNKDRIIMIQPASVVVGNTIDVGGVGNSPSLETTVTVGAIDNDLDGVSIIAVVYVGV